MFERLGDESRYRRFLTPKKRLTESELTALTAVDHHDHEALVAIVPDADEEKGAGIARYVRSAVPSPAVPAVRAVPAAVGRAVPAVPVTGRS